MWYLALYAVFALWVVIDGQQRKDGFILWGLGTFLLGPIILPIYLARRPLKPGEIREGGRGWNILKNFALFWTILMFVAGIVGLVGASETVATADSEAEQAGAAIGTILGLGLLGATWFFPMVGALVLGLFLKNSSIVERGTPLEEPAPAPVLPAA